MTWQGLLGVFSRQVDSAGAGAGTNLLADTRRILNVQVCLGSEARGSSGSASLPAGLLHAVSLDAAFEGTALCRTGRGVA
jgi:hypothetical protein